MQKLTKKFAKFKKNDKLNTSYPVRKEDWLKYKTERELEFNGNKICYYIHIPFCLSRCKFCEYVKYNKTTFENEKKYIDILISDIEKFSQQNKDKVLYGLDIGGGTPTCLENENFQTLLEYINNNVFKKFKLSEDFEPSIESTFLSINEEKVKIISESNIKRISFGLQTVNKKFLKENDRVNPTLKRMSDTFSWCEKYGIKKVNIDLMYGLKGQKKGDLTDALATIEHFMPEQVTLYEFRTNILNIKENKTKRQLFNEYCYLFNKLLKMGYYGQFGQNTFSLDKNDLGLSSYIRNRMLENLPYKGFGISAQSKSEEGVSYNIGKSEKTLEDCLNKGSFIEEDTYILPKEEMAAKYIAISGYCGRFSLKILDNILEKSSREIFKEELGFLLKKRYIRIDNGIVFITKKGFVHYGAILSLFYPKQSI